MVAVHSFEVEDAEKYGMLEAVLLYNIKFWVKKNEANERNFIDGRYWTRNSAAAFAKLFPYASKDKIKRALKHLVDEGVLITGRYGEDQYDRSYWYSVANFAPCTGQICTVDETDLHRGRGNSAPCYIYNNNNIDSSTDINTDINTDSSLDNSIKVIDKNIHSEELSKELSHKDVGRGKFQWLVDEWNTLKQYGIAELRGIAETGNRPSLVKARLREYGDAGFRTAIENIRHSKFLQGNNNRGWQITFDWLIKPSNFPKVLEGNYNDKDHGGISDIEREVKSWV